MNVTRRFRARTDGVPVHMPSFGAMRDRERAVCGVPVGGNHATTDHHEPIKDGNVTEDVTSKRARTRDSLFLTAHLRLAEEAGLREVRVRNLSEGGLMVELAKVVDVGTTVALDLRGIGEVTGKVAWCTAGRIGIALDALIDPKKARQPIDDGETASTRFHAKVSPPH